MFPMVGGPSILKGDRAETWREIICHNPWGEWHGPHVAISFLSPSILQLCRPRIVSKTRCRHFRFLYSGALRLVLRFEQQCLSFLVWGGSFLCLTSHRNRLRHRFCYEHSKSYHGHSNHRLPGIRHLCGTSRHAPNDGGRGASRNSLEFPSDYPSLH